jgi:hypothetical protein
MSNITAETICLLSLPATLPDDARVYQTISVIEDMNDDDRKIHVEFADMMDFAESWGMYLVDVARAMVRDYGESFETEREDGDLFAAICDGFNKPVK